MIPHIIAALLGIALPALILGRGFLALIICLVILLIIVDAIKTSSLFDIRRAFLAEWKRPQGIFLAIIFIFCIPSIFASDTPLRSFNASVRTLGFCLIATLFYVYLKSRPNLSGVWIKWLIISFVLSMALAYFSQFVSPELYWFLHLKGIKNEPLGHTLKGYTSLATLIIPLLVFSCYHSRKLLFFVALLSAISLLFLIWLIANRAAIAGLLAAIICLSIAIGTRHGNKRQIIQSAGFSVFCMGGVLFWLHYNRFRYSLQVPEGDYFFPTWLIDHPRQTIWSHALDIALQTPWFGRGANTINLAPSADKIIEGTLGLHVIPAHPHNWPIELFAEIGIFGLITVVIFIFFCTIQMLHAYKISTSPAVLTTLTVFAGYWVSGLFNFSFWAAWWQLSFMISIALVLSTHPGQATKSGP
jgi:O-antigen ligase